VKVLITGIAGRLARGVAEGLLGSGHAVVGIDRRAWPEAPEAVSVVQADLLGRDAEETFRRERPDAVVHMASVSRLNAERHERYRVNLGGTRQLFEHARSHGVGQVIFVGRHTYYGAVPDAPLYRREDEPPMALESFPELSDLVAADLFATSTLWRDPGIKTSILRFVYTLGPALHGTLAAFLRGPRVPMLLGFDPLFQLMHEEDATRAIVLSLEKRLRGVFNVAGPQPLPLSELIRVTERVPTRLTRSMFRIALGRFGLPTMPAGATDHVKYPIVVDDAAFRQATGFDHRHDEYATLRAFLDACPPRRVQTDTEP
jgi:UDP-glucose 4-epimerase